MSAVEQPVASCDMLSIFHIHLSQGRTGRAVGRERGLVKLESGKTAFGRGVRRSSVVGLLDIFIFCSSRDRVL